MDSESSTARPRMRPAPGHQQPCPSLGWVKPQGRGSCLVIAAVRDIVHQVTIALASSTPGSVALSQQPAADTYEILTLGRGA